MLKFKLMLGVIAVMMVLTLAQSGYAQLSISVTANPNPTADAVGVTEFTNDPTVNSGVVITGTVLSDAPFTGGRLRFTYPSAVTNACTAAASTTSTGCAAGATNGPANDSIVISLATGIFKGAALASVNAVAGRVDISLPCSTGTTGSSNFGYTTMTGFNGTIVLHGVRIDASVISSFPASASVSTVSGVGITTAQAGQSNGPGGAQSAAYSGNPECPSTAITGVSGTGGSVSPANVILNTTTIPVINASAQGIGGVNTGGMPSSVSTPAAGGNVLLGVTGTCPGVDGFHANCGIATIYTNRNVPKSVASFTVNGGFNTAWYHNDNTNLAGDDLTSGASTGPGTPFTTNDASFTLTFNNVPSGVTLTLGIAAFTTSGMPAPTLSSGTITTANNTSIVTWNGDLSTSSTAWVTFRVTGITVPSSGTLAGGSISVSANMQPVGTALNLTAGTGSAAIITTAYPRFISNVVGNATVVSIVPANTTLLIPFAFQGGGLDTGIALANTSVDPFGAQGAIAQSGTVTVSLFPSTATGAGTAGGFTTSATKHPGQGITAADGTIAPGATWTVNLSDVLSASGVTGGFSGYIFIQANFLPAHGIAYIYGAGVFGQTGASTFTSFTPVFVLPPPSTNGRGGFQACQTGGGCGAEDLSF